MICIYTYKVDTLFSYTTQTMTNSTNHRSWLATGIMKRQIRPMRITYGIPPKLHIAQVKHVTMCILMK